MKRPLLASLVCLFAFACGESSKTTSSSTDATSSSSASAASSTTGSTSSSGAGGMTSSSSTTSSSGMGGTTASSTSASTGAGGATGNGHILLSEIGVAPAGGEFIEIYNATAAAVDLSSYYLSDNAAYYGIAAGMAWNPVTSNPGTDFLAQFPAGTMLAPGGIIVVATSSAYEMQFNKCPDFILTPMDFKCANGTAKAMVAPMNGGIGDKAGLSNDREMVILFHWDGAKKVVEDVDYVTWGAMFAAETRVDKTAVSGYQPDTAIANQKPAVAPPPFQSVERCDPKETGEKASGGNGLLGHDETSEPMDTTFVLQTKPTPGVKNVCLP